MSRAAPAAVITLLLLAGCAGVLPDGGNGSSGPAAGTDATPAVGGATSTVVTTPVDVEYPDGFGPTEVRADVARSRTVSLLRSGPVVVSALERFRPGAYADYRYAANATHTRFRRTVHNGFSDVTETDIYADPTARYRRIARNDRTMFGTSNGSAAETRGRVAPGIWAILSRILQLGQFRASGSYRTDGEQWVRYELTGTVYENATDERGHLLVDGEGVIREARMTFTRSGEPKRFEYAVLSRSDVRVTVPPWLSAAADD